MINRRKLIHGIAGSAVAAAGVSGGILRTADARNADLPGLVPKEEEAEQVLYEIARLDARYYTEEGVAMLLSCENLAAPTLESFEPDELNARFAAGFQHYAALLAELRSDLSGQDVATIVELLAWRDFANVGGSHEE